MNTQSLTINLSVSQSPQQVFDAINDVRAWWSGQIDGPTDQLGSVFEYRYKDFHRSVQKIIDFVPGRRVVWRVVEAHLGFVKDKNEWNGTEIIFEIMRKGDRTELRFTHDGLVPAFQCYGDCEGAWGFYIKESLHSLITTGKGVPNTD